jgi:hypothetical protein
MRLVLFAVLVCAAAGMPVPTQAQTETYEVFNYTRFDPWRDKYCHVTGPCIGVWDSYVSAVVHSENIHPLGFTEYFLGIRGFWEGPIPQNRASTITITGLSDDGVAVAGFHDQIDLLPDGTFEFGGSAEDPCGYYAPHQVACGFDGNSTQTTSPVKIDRLEFLMWNVHDYDTWVTTTCRVDASDCFAVPEPHSVLLIATGLLGLAFVRRRREHADGTG